MFPANIPRLVTMSTCDMSNNARVNKWTIRGLPVESSDLRFEQAICGLSGSKLCAQHTGGIHGTLCTKMIIKSLLSCCRIGCRVCKTMLKVETAVPGILAKSFE